MMSEQYAKWLARRTQNVRERIQRLNPNGPADGVMIRGYHPTNDSWFWMCRDVMRKGRFIKRFGREAWAKLPRQAIVKTGRREGVSGLTMLQLGLRP